MTNDLRIDMNSMGAKARNAASVLATTPHTARNAALVAAANHVAASLDRILEANALDMDFAQQKGLSPSMMDRLKLDAGRINTIRESLLAIADQPDPIGEILAEWDQPTGLNIQRVSTPIGVIGVIYESRPNVTADAGALCLKSGNAVILRCGSESLYSSQAIHACLVQGLKDAGLPEASIQLVNSRDRQAVGDMLTLTDHIDVIIPRGGKGLVERVQKEARIPVFAHLEGICHVYIDRAADPEKAVEIVLNAKTRRPGICGAAECLLVHEDAHALGQAVINALMSAGVAVYAEGFTGTRPADRSDFGKEFLDMKMAARQVCDLDAAIEHIRTYGSGHTDAIITEDTTAAESFFQQLDSAILMHNASTQFADGGEFGMGAEIGIATGKLHARGPVGTRQLTSFKYLVRSEGAVRA